MREEVGGADRPADVAALFAGLVTMMLWGSSFVVIRTARLEA